MNIYILGAIIIFGVFVVILIFNPNISCFGRKVKSPFYPLIRKKRKKASEEKKKKIDDYGFSLVDEKSRRRPRIDHVEPKKRRKDKKDLKIDDYGFTLSNDKKKQINKDKTGEKK
ncbi:MAG: hypothetical protein ACOC5S_01385 [Acidobacteriota bacterium]